MYLCRLLIGLLLVLFVAGCGRENFGTKIKPVIDELGKCWEFSKKVQDFKGLQGQLSQLESACNKLVEMRNELNNYLPESEAAKTRLFRKYTPPLASILGKIQEERNRIKEIEPPEKLEDEEKIDDVIFIDPATGKRTSKGIGKAVSALDSVMQAYFPLLWKKEVIKLTGWN